MLIFLVLGAACIGGLVWCVYVCFAKGKGAMGLFGILFVWPVAVIGAIRLAKPNSRWAMTRYDAAKLSLAEARFADDPGQIVQRETRDEIADAWAGEEINPEELDSTTRRALRKAGRLP